MAVRAHQIVRAGIELTSGLAAGCMHKQIVPKNDSQSNFFVHVCGSQAAPRVLSNRLHDPLSGPFHRHNSE